MHPVSPAAERDAVERWFLSRGLPAVLKPGALLHRIGSRSAPALAALATFAGNSVAVVALAGSHTIDIVGRPTVTEGVVLVLLTLVTPLAALVGWLVSRIDSIPSRVLIANISIAVIALGVLFGGPSPRRGVNITIVAVCLAFILVFTVTGLGSVLGWAAHMTLSNLAHSLLMLGRALPVVLLTFLVFFNGHVWLMVAVISRERLWFGMGFLYLLAAAFLISGTLDRVRAVLSDPAPAAGAAAELAGTPFENVEDTPGSEPLSALERVNVVFVVTASQLAHVFAVAALTGVIYFVLGLILVSPELLNLWTRDLGRTDGNLAGMILPVPDALIQISMLLTAITFMYLAAKAVTDTAYRTKLLDPMLDDVRVTLAARERYRAAAG